ncbi:MAG TPA: NADH-quinone oxidoreductase subunit A [Terriglobales bacterium]|nr:NADH-quinone oxidoreductase subunit A [Terriglobales bacterium]
MVWIFVGYSLAVLLISSSMILISHYLGERHRETATFEPYESGIAPTGSARIRFSTKFYLVAIFFLVFDIEAIFLFAWSIVARRAGWAGYGVALIFIGVLTAALVYEWRLGVLDWGAPKRKITASEDRSHAVALD